MRQAWWSDAGIAQARAGLIAAPWRPPRAIIFSLPQRRCTRVRIDPILMT